MQLPAGRRCNLVRLEILSPLVHDECAGILLFVDHIGRRARSYAHSASWELVHFARFLKFPGLGDVLEPLENESLYGIVLIRHRLSGIHALDDVDALLESL